MPVLKWRKVADVTEPGIYLARHRKEPVGNAWLAWITSDDGELLWHGNRPPRDTGYAAPVSAVRNILVFGPIPEK